MPPSASRSLAEIEELIKPRLASMFERQNVLVRPDQPLYPFAHAELEGLINQRTRDVLETKAQRLGLAPGPGSPGDRQPEAEDRQQRAPGDELDEWPPPRVVVDRPRADVMRQQDRPALDVPSEGEDQGGGRIDLDRDLAMHRRR